MVLCAANAYEQKYYLNPAFEDLPTQIKEELKILCVLFTEENSGIFLLEFDEDGSLLLQTKAAENDFMYDEIGAGLRVSRLQREHEELFRSLELYYRVFFDGAQPEDCSEGDDYAE